MYQLDEKLMADNRAIISLASDMEHIDPNLKPGMQVFNAKEKDTYVVASQQRYYRLLHEDALTKKIPYDLNFAGTVTIDKDLIVKGSLTNLESQDLIIKDNIIELNKDEIGNGITKIQSGIEINRGTRERARMLFSEATDRASTSGFVFNLNDTTLMSIYQDGDVKTLKDFYTCSANVRDDLTVGRDFTLTRNALIKGTLTVNQAAALKSTLTVTGTSTLTGAASLKSTLAVTGITTLSNTLSVAEKGTFAKELDVVGNTALKANLDVTSNTTIGGTLAVTGATSLNSTLNVTGATTLNSTLRTIGDVTFDKTLTVIGATTLNSTVGITGELKTTSIKNSENITTKTLSVTESANIGTSLNVGGITTLNGATNLKSTLDVLGNATIHYNLTVGEEATLHNLTVNESTVLNNVLTVREFATFYSTVTTKKKATFEQDIEVGTNALIRGNLNVTGITNLAKTTISGDLDANGINTLNTLKVTGTSDFTGVLSSINMRAESLTLRTSRNALQWEDGTVIHSIFGANNSSDRYYSLYDVATNDYNLTFKTMPIAGKEKGFVFVSGTAPLLHINQSSVRSQNDIYVKRSTTWSPLLARADQHKANHSIGGHDFLSPADIGAVKNTKGTPEIITDNETNKPAAGVAGRLFFAKDAKRIWQDLGNVWQIIGGQETIPWGNVTGKPATYPPPIATASVLGGVKIGNNILVDPDGTIHVPKQTIEYTVHVEQVKATANQKVFTLSKSFLIGRNHVSPYLFGRRVPTSAFKEIADNKIEFLEGLPADSLLEFYVLLIPNDLSFVMKIEEFNLAENQTRLVLTQGKYTVGANKLKIFLNGALMPRSSFRETSATSIELLQCPGVGNHILIEYMYDPLAT